MYCSREAQSLGHHVFWNEALSHLDHTEGFLCVSCIPSEFTDQDKDLVPWW